jgi:hypothetical protein
VLLWILLIAAGIFIVLGGAAMVTTSIIFNRGARYLDRAAVAQLSATDSINKTIELVRSAADRHAALRTAETKVLHDLIVDMETQLRYVATNLAEEAGIAGRTFHGQQQIPVLGISNIIEQAAQAARDNMPPRTEPVAASHRALDLPDLCRYFGMPDSEQEAMFKWLADPMGTTYTVDQADQLYQLWCEDHKERP